MIPLIIVGTVTYINSYRVLEDISKMQTTQIATSLSGTITLAIEKELKTLSATAKDPRIIAGASRGDYESLRAKLADLYEKIGSDYESIAVFDTKGIIRVDAVDQKRVGISVAERSYIETARQGKTGISPVNASKATGSPIFGLVAPIMRSDGKYLGCVLGVLKVDFLLKYILSLKLGQTGYAIMLDKNGTVIAHPNLQYILKLDSLKDEELRENTKKMISGKSGTGEYTYRGTTKIIGFAPVEASGWSVGVIQNKNEVMTLAYTNRNLILLVSAFFLLLTIVAVYYFSKTISAPVQKTLDTLNQAIEQATEPIFIIGPNNKVYFANPALGRILDRPMKDIIGKKPYLNNTGTIAPEAIWDILMRGKVWNGCVTGIKKNRSAFSMDLTITPVRNKAGDVSCFLAMGRDISRELAMEAQLRQSQKMEAIGTLAGGIAHDFNNILGAVFGYSELTLSYLQDQEKPKHFINEIIKAAGRARELVKQIMTFSRQAEQRKQPLCPKPIIKETLKLLRASLPTTIDIIEDIKSDAFIFADPTQIHQIIMNLCTNAGHAMKDHGGILSITLDDIVISQQPDPPDEKILPGNYVLLNVSDTGCGISPDIISRIFDPFYTTKPQGEGTGLGLSVVHGIVKSLNGVISVSSNVGQGTTFTIYLPAIGEIIADEKMQCEKELPRGTEKILLVDDEEAIVQTGKAMLEGLGYHVSEFTQSFSALDCFQKNPFAFDAVITDYTMPHLTGLDLAHKIKTLRPDIPIMMWSGYFEDAEKKIKSAGISELVKKPIARYDLSVALRRLFQS